MTAIRKSSLVSVVVASLILAACGSNTDDSSNNDPAEVAGDGPDVADDLREAPGLADMVEAGDLPPVADRLPALDDIMVEPVYEQIGEYGGSWDLPWMGQQSPWEVGKITEEALFRFTAEGDGVEPNVAKGYDVNDDYTEFTIYLREGMKWSDGEDFTARDVLFWWEHIMQPELFQRSVYDAFYSTDPDTGERTQATIEQVDDHTFTVSFAHPRVLFLERLAIDAKWMYAPAHWLEEILDEFVGDDATDAVMEEYGFADREGFYESITYYFWIWPDRPTIRAWKPVDDPNENRIVWERNPYYWKTDGEGNQLPYIDELVLNSVQDASHILLETMAGNFDIVRFGFEDFTTLAENQDAGNYRIYQWDWAALGSEVLQLNQTVEDEDLRELIQDIRFREALSVAVDREELVEILTLGLGQPIQASFSEAHPYYQEGWAEQWAEFDPDRSEQLLEEIGLEKNGQWWTFDDGTPVTLEILQLADDGQAGRFEELLQFYFEEIGIQTNVRLVDRGSLDDAFWANEHVATTAFTVGGVSPHLRPDTLVPLSMVTPWHSQWGAYYETGGESGVEPTPEIEAMWDAWSALSSSTDVEAIESYSDEIVRLHMENQWLLGFTGHVPNLIVVNNDIVNVPEQTTIADEFRELGHGRPMQFSFVGLDD
ncbi:ABC transporter substrate-binding protein [Bogoriella caseilytica]|uniref:Peptide/nickel transport system substrate-binding protein n=1 Tax=Bogoriella caseilytica TaxID=56055 RepID=A0A3N2BD06_9MICO|nr:ABC transporter substrate-binding protein [Bogoriella caseilytica]ROR73140.1 peptide/nickel transport system substrate-binding protein [Bogoriella caseilytica]